MENSAKPEEPIIVDANSVVTFHQGIISENNSLSILVTVRKNQDGSHQLVQLCPSFKPGMTYQIFKDEKIVGIKDPEIDIYFNPSTCDVWLHVLL